MDSREYTTFGIRIDCTTLEVVDKKEYIAISPEEETIFIYGYSKNNGQPELLHIESDEEYAKVSEAFMLLCDEDEDLHEDDTHEEK
ncbi:DUF1292 domain-containing protein [Clostridiaceae bacterium M8S5]|nr:DUF1292 domain-containing protein [Clostridiaceae bacterium M8S5]